MQEAAGLATAIAAVRAVEQRFGTASDGELLADLAAIEELGRMVDFLRVAGAGEVESRSRRTLGEDSLAFRSSARDGVELVQQVARVSRSTARQRVGLGCAVASRLGLDGSPLPGRYPEVRQALAAGEIGVDSARVVVNALKAVPRHADQNAVAVMTEALVQHARTQDAEFVADTARWWLEAVDPDGSEPRDRARHRQRAVRLGRIREDGTTAMSVVLPPEQLAIIKELLQSRRRARGLFRVEPGSAATGDDLGPEWRERQQDEDDEGPAVSNPRSRAQQDFDSLFDVIDAGIRAEQDGTASTAVTHEVVVQITAAELEARQGQGWTSGVLAGLPIPVIERKACTGGVRLVVTGARGEPLHLGRVQRLFTSAQKKALLVAAGGRCQYPGCRVPGPFLEAHHAAWSRWNHAA